MPLSLKHPEIDRLARALARERDQSITQTILEALQKLGEGDPFPDQDYQVKQLLELGKGLSKARTTDKRSDEEILGYDAKGLPQ